MYYQPSLLIRLLAGIFMIKLVVPRWERLSNLSLREKGKSKYNMRVSDLMKIGYYLIRNPIRIEVGLFITPMKVGEVID